MGASSEPLLGPLLSSLPKNDFDQKAEDYRPKAFITDLRTVASYNWLDRTEPTIMVPGKPPKWTLLSKPARLRADDGDYFRDPNSANFPKHPMEPTIIAAVTMQPDISRQIDVVACGSTIGNLLRFLQGEDKPFRILIKLVGETAFFIRRENSPRELIPGVHGYGHTFPEAYTTWGPDVKGSTSHQRVISYRFGGQAFLVRFEGDGYLQGNDSDDDCSSVSAGSGDVDVGVGLESVTAKLAGNRVTSKLPETAHSELEVIGAGKLVSQDQMFDLKTRSFRKKETETLEVTLEDQLKRLWVAQIPQFILAYHDRGLFNDINVRTVRDEVKDWEISHVDVLSRLAALIHRIISLVKARFDNKVELRHDATGILEVREQLADAGDALSRKWSDMWTKGGEGGSREAVDENQTDRAEESGDDGWEVGWEPDYTACSAHACGYCGRCSY